MKKLLLAVTVASFFGSVAILASVVIRDFIFWSVWPDTHHYLLSDDSDSESFMTLLRFIFLFFFFIGLFASIASLDDIKSNLKDPTNDR